MVKYSDILDECTASFFRVTGLVLMDAEVVRRKISFDYMGQFEIVCSVSAMEGGKLGQDFLNFMLLLVAKLQSTGMRHHVVWLMGIRADPEDQGSVFPENVGSHLSQDYMALQPKHNVGTYCHENLKY